MKIGYSVEGSTDRALLRGLRERWCPSAELVEGRFRGRSGVSQSREIPNTCRELFAKGADVAVFIRDANNEEWREVRKADSARCLDDCRHLAVFAICDRNVESWFCSDAGWIAVRTGREAAEFSADDPKGSFESAMKIKASDRKELEIAALLKDAPLRAWLNNKSFETFYEDLRQKSKELGCEFENLRQATEP